MAVLRTFDNIFAETIVSRWVNPTEFFCKLVRFTHAAGSAIHQNQ